MDLLYLSALGVLSLLMLGLIAGCAALGAQEVTWAYLLSGLLSAALLIYLVAALIRAEDL